MSSAAPIPTTRIIIAMMSIPPAPAGSCTGVVSDAVAMYAVNVGSCSIL